jgi:hypothetical protein
VAPGPKAAAAPGPKAAAPGPKAAGAALPDKRVQAMFDSPVAATEKIPELKELSKLIKASPNVTKVLSDKNLVATIFAPNNDVSTKAHMWMGGVGRGCCCTVCGGVHVMQKLGAMLLMCCIRHRCTLLHAVDSTEQFRLTYLSLA